MWMMSMLVIIVLVLLNFFSPFLLGDGSSWQVIARKDQIFVVGDHVVSILTLILEVVLIHKTIQILT